MLNIPFDNTYARELQGFYVDWKPAPAPAPRWLYLNHGLLAELGLDTDAMAGPAGLAALSGNELPRGAQPIAQAYAGHQFGGFSPQLGDGRALLLGEVLDTRGQRRDIAFKGSGRTPFSRGGDGKAAVGPMLREVLVSEAMHALGIPTTRALAVVATGENVLREALFPGAVLTRVAASHLRVGTFQYFAARGEHDKLRQLLDYALARHEVAGVPARPAHERPLALLRAVAHRQAALIAQWMNVGFIHGVMNTDNMTISGETIDYGPCAFIEAYDPDTVFSSIDHGGRYAFGRQPGIARWNLARLAEALLPLMADGGDEAAVQRAVAQVTDVIDEFPALYAAQLLRGQCAKLGLPRADQGPQSGEQDGEQDGEQGSTRDDRALAEDWLSLLQQHQVDHTLAWRRLCDAAAGDANPLRALFPDPAAVNPWLLRWQQGWLQSHPGRTGPGSAEQAALRAAAMRRVNPYVIPRNHRVEEALAAATAGEMAPFRALLEALTQPFEETPALARYAEPAPQQVTAAYQTYCGT